MGKFYKEALKYKSMQELVELNEILAIFEKSKKEGRSELDPVEKEKVNNKLSQMENRLKKEIDMHTKRAESENIEAWDFSHERELGVFAEDDVILLRPLQDNHKDLYIQIKKENANIVSTKSEEEQTEYWNDIWDDTRLEERFVMEAVTKEDNKFVGYVAVNNTRRTLWELSIELLSDFLCNGYGTHALRLFVDKLYEITGRAEYQLLVEVDNVKSQMMLKHLDAKLVGIKAYFFANEEDAVKFEEQYLDEIDDHMCAVAAELGIEARKLISHVLDYRVKPQSMDK